MVFGLAKVGNDAQALAKHLRDNDDIDTALKAYNAERQPIGNKVVMPQAARTRSSRLPIPPRS
jgi:2-polyprenyl-6-methoxyphenol hydroxylase-like FAD-dependent oxidoreductase